MATEQPNWELLLNSAHELAARGARSFTLSDLIAAVQATHPGRERTSLQPIVQGMTLNAPDGAPQSACGKVFVRVGRGEYRLLSAADQLPNAVTAIRAPSETGNTRCDLARRIEGLISSFEEWVTRYDEGVPFRRIGQYELHRATIDRRREVGTAAAALKDERLLALLHQTLNTWGIGKRASRLAPLPEFSSALQAHTEMISDLDGLAIEELGQEAQAVGAQILTLVDNLGVVENKARLVAGSKTLHHLLPDLVPPMDRAWTGAFFRWPTAAWQDRQHRIFHEGWSAFARVAASVHPSRFVGDGWRTSSTKILDNALIGYCKAHEIGG